MTGAAEQEAARGEIATLAVRARDGGTADPAARIAQIRHLPVGERSHDLWLELIRLEAAADPNEARDTMAAARERFASAPFVLGLIDRAAAETGLEPDRGGPDDAQIAAARMTPAKREGMVAGLAARLEENPQDPEGWAMLIRSYAVLDRPEEAREAREAREALEAALAAFPDRPEVADRLRRTAAQFAIR